MSDQTSWKAEEASAGVIVAGRHGAASGTAGVQVERRTPSLATVIAAKQSEAEVLKILRDFAEADAASSRFIHGTCDIIWSGPSQWLVAMTGRDAVAALTIKLGELAAVTDQTDARAVLRLSGPRVRETLAKGCSIDLHPRAFKPGDVALTAISHIGVQIWQVDDAPTFEIAISRSMVESFWSWFDASAAEFGYVVK